MSSGIRVEILASWLHKIIQLKLIFMAQLPLLPNEGSSIQFLCFRRLLRGTALVIHCLRLHLPLQGMQVQSLVREVRSHMPYGKKKKKNIKQNFLVADMQQSQAMLKFLHYMRSCENISFWAVGLRPRLSLLSEEAFCWN